MSRENLQIGSAGGVFAAVLPLKGSFPDGSGLWSGRCCVIIPAERCRRKKGWKLPLLLDLFLTFFRIGVFTFGGGYAMLPMLQKELVDKKGWVTEEEILDYFAIGQCTPGVIAVNTATFVGFKMKKAAGGIVATLGVVAPSILIITIIAAVLSNFAHIPAVKNAFAGIRVAVCVLIINSVVKLLKKSVVDKLTAAVYIAVALCAILFSKVSPVIFVVSAALLGIIIRVFIQGRKEEVRK